MDGRQMACFADEHETLSRDMLDYYKYRGVLQDGVSKDDLR